MRVLACLLMFLMLMGCQRAQDFIRAEQKKKAQNAPALKMVEDTHLAKLLLKPERKVVKLNRDPFRPLIGTEETEGEQPGEAPIKNKLSDVTFLGLVRMSNETLALIKTQEKRFLLKKNDRYREYHVSEISNDQMVFFDGNTKITLKRGVKK